MATPRVRYRHMPNAQQKVEAIGQHRKPYEDFYHWVLTMSGLEFTTLIVAIFLSINMLFALLYILEPGGIVNARSQNFEDAFYFSVQTFATIGYGYMAPVSRWANTLVVLESFSGILTTAVVTGLAFARFARPSARVLYSEKLVICPRDGVPHLMMRLANWRHNNVVEAQIRMVILMTERTREGDVMRRPVELPLVRDRTNLFLLSWTVMHKIDENSPFYGPDALKRLQEDNVALFISFTGLDENLGQNIHSRYYYTMADIVPDARFVDILNVLPDGTRQINYHHFHDVQPLDAS